MKAMSSRWTVLLAMVYLGAIPTLPADFSDELRELLGWADEVADLKVLANADTPEAAKKAREYGAMGIGLCRTERMFNASDRLPIVIDMILANNEEDRKLASTSCCRYSGRIS